MEIENTEIKRDKIRLRIQRTKEAKEVKGQKEEQVLLENEKGSIRQSREDF